MEFFLLSNEWNITIFILLFICDKMGLFLKSSVHIQI